MIMKMNWHPFFPLSLSLFLQPHHSNKFSLKINKTIKWLRKNREREREWERGREREYICCGNASIGFFRFNFLKSINKTHPRFTILITLIRHGHYIELIIFLVICDIFICRISSQIVVFLDFKKKIFFYLQLFL